VEVATTDPNARLNIWRPNGSQRRANKEGRENVGAASRRTACDASEHYDDNPEWQEIPESNL